MSEPSAQALPAAQTLRRGLAILRLLARSHYAIQRSAAPAVRDLAASTGDTLCISVRQGFEAVCLSVERGLVPLPPAVLQVGDRYPLGISSAGLAILSAQDDGCALGAITLIASESRLGPTRRAVLADRLRALCGEVTRFASPA